ncbi:MAG: hypothetical protein VW338_00935 [Rhodospirillaceae bacterium]
MTTGSMILAGAAALATAIGVVFGPDMVAPSQIVVECGGVIVDYGEGNAVRVSLTNCRAGEMPVAIVVPESAPF